MLEHLLAGQSQYGRSPNTDVPFDLRRRARPRFLWGEPRNSRKRPFAEGHLDGYLTLEQRIHHTCGRLGRIACKEV